MPSIDNLLFLNELEKLKLPKNRFVICGSAPLLLRNIIDTIEDLDITVTDDLWNNLSRKYLVKRKYVKNILKDYIQVGNIEIMHTTDGCYDKYETVFDLIKSSEIIDNYHVITLEETINCKKYFGREKDYQHIKLIKKYLKENKKYK